VARFDPSVFITGMTIPAQEEGGGEGELGEVGVTSRGVLKKMVSDTDLSMGRGGRVADFNESGRMR